MVTFGLLTDTHMANRPPWANRYYQASARKMDACMEAFQAQGVDFVVHTGDVIDEPGNTQAGTLAANQALEVLHRFTMPKHFVLGNHDIDSIPKQLFQQLFHMPPGPCHYAFSVQNYRFILLDCLYRQDGSPYTPGTVDWEALYIPQEQQHWLKRELAQAGNQHVILFVHGLLDALDDPHAIRNAGAVREILQTCPAVRAVFQGHMHTGHFSLVRGIPYFTLPAIVESQTGFTCWTVQAGDEGLRITVHTQAQNMGMQIVY